MATPAHAASPSDPPPDGQPPPHSATPAGTATLTLPDGRAIPLPVLTDAAGATFVDIATLFPRTGVCTLDVGFSSTAACASSITYIDGGAGVLLYRGIPVEDLANRGDWADAAFLVLHGALPTSAQKAAFEEDITRHTLVNETLIAFYKGFRPDAHPMAILAGVMGGLSGFYPSTQAVRDPAQRLRAVMRMVAKMPTLAALAYRTSRGLPLVYPKNSMSYVERFLYMLFSMPTEQFEFTPARRAVVRALEALIILQ
jgi:citrate synthase